MFPRDETWLKRILTLREDQFRLDHQDTLGTMHNLATIYISQGHYDKSKTQLNHVLALTEKHLGSEHSYMLGILHNIATVYRDDTAESENCSNVYWRSGRSSSVWITQTRCTEYMASQLSSSHSVVKRRSRCCAIE
jgi:ATP/maltotriose-dependent transcriptional regulator MalT